MTGDARRPMSDRLAAGAPPELVGRADALSLVGRALRGGPALVVVEGEAGIGKTSLLRRALGDLGGDGVLQATCPAVTEPAPLGAVVAAIRRWAPAAPALGLSGLAGALRPLFPEWGADLPPTPEPLDDPSAVRHRVYRALTELVERLGARILVLEDAHWADSATLEWLLTLSAEVRGLSIVVSFRPWDVPAGSLLPRLIGRAPAGRSRVRIELTPLTSAQIRQFVASVYATDAISEVFVEFLHKATDGIPLVLEEYLLLLEDREDILRADGRWTRRALAELTVPASVRESVVERVRRLDPDTQRVLEAISILGDPADEPLVAAVADLDRARARTGVATALARGLLREHSVGRFVFRHITDAQAVGESLPVSERRRLHARAGEVLHRQDHPPVARLAHHFLAAGDIERWSGYAEASARVAWESGDDRTAVETLLQVMDTSGIPVDRQARLARTLCQAAFFGAAALGGLAQRVVEVLTRLLDTGQTPRAERGELRLQLGRMLWEVGEWTTAFEQWERAVDDLVERPDLAIRAMSNMGLPLVPDWPRWRHRHWLDRAGDLLDRVAAPDQQAFLQCRALALLLLGDDDGWRAVRELPHTAATRTEEQDLASVRVNVALAMLVWGRYGEARSQLDTARLHLEESGYSRRIYNMRATQVRLDWFLGRWAGLSERAGELAACEEADSPSRVHARQVHALLQLASGARATAQRNLQQIVDQLNGLGMAQPEGVSVSAAVARLHLSDGDAEAALAVTTPAVQLVSTKGVWLWVTDIAAVHVDALLAAGREQSATTFVSRFAAHVRDRDQPAPAAGLATCQAILAEGTGAPAAALFDAAARAWAALPRPYDELLCRERQGQALLAAGDQEAALELLTTTQQRMYDLGARWDADRVAHLVRGHGQEVVRTWHGGRRGYGDQLSPRQVDVVRLVARGLTNRQVAERLYLSPRTVEGHVMSAMRKLDANSRTALAVAAVEAGLVDPDEDVKFA